MAAKSHSYGDLTANARYELLDKSLDVGDVPDFRATHARSNGHIESAECIVAMAEWLDERINAGESRAHYQNDSYQSISTRSNINHWEYRKSPVLPRPRTMDTHNASCIRVSLKGTVDPDTRYTCPKPKTDAYQHLWNIVSKFAHATGAEVRLQYSESPRDDLNAYLFYNFD